MNVNYVLELFKELAAHLKKYGDQSIAYQYQTLLDAIDVLEADYSDEDKEDCIVTCYKRLYPGRAGLSEFFVSKEDYHFRITPKLTALLLFIST